MKKIKLIIGGCIILTPIIGLYLTLNSLNSSNNSDISNTYTLCNLGESKGEIEIRGIKIIKRVREDIFFKQRERISLVDKANCREDIVINRNSLESKQLEDFNKTYNLKLQGGDYPKLLSVLN